MPISVATIVIVSLPKVLLVSVKVASAAFTTLKVPVKLKLLVPLPDRLSPVAAVALNKPFESVITAVTEEFEANRSVMDSPLMAVGWPKATL